MQYIINTNKRSGIGKEFSGLLEKFSKVMENKYLGIEYLIEKAMDERNIFLLEDFSTLIDEIQDLKKRRK